MANKNDLKSIIDDALESLKLVARLSWQQNVTAWLYVPVGILLILLVCFGVDSLIGLSTVTFPASVAVLVILFFGLMLIDSVFGDRKTRALVNVIDIPAGWALRYLNIFFTPSFVRLPLSGPISGVEVAKIIAVFLIGFLVTVAGTAYFVRGLQLLLGSTKRAQIERAEELGNESDAIPLSDARMPSGRDTSRNNSEITFPPTPSAPSTPEEATTPLHPLDTPQPLDFPQRAQDPNLVRGTGGPPESNVDFTAQSITRANLILQPQAPLPLTRPQRWAFFLNKNFDRITYLLIFLFIGLPIYYSTGYAMPAQLSFNILAYFAALSLPVTWRRFLHPVLVSAGVTILGLWILGLIKGDSLTQSLDIYRTQTSYLSLWHGRKNLAKPGAGDVLVSILDAGIVALALPMYNYRLELKRHFFAIVVPNIAVSIGSLFAYPPVCHAIGISAKRALAFPVRSLTLALATPAAKNLGGDANTASALAIMSGIIGALIGSQMLDRLRIPDDDYVTRGVTLGGSSSAIVTAVLLQSDPRAAALSSLSMSLFGIITLALTSVPIIVKAVQSLVGK